MIDPTAFRTAMRHVPTGVTVVTSLKDGEPRGITVNALASVSLDPPSLLICINREARSYLFISTSRIFCVNVLAGNQRRLAEHFSGRVRERQFADIAYGTDATGAPVLHGTIAHFDCEVAHEYHFGSHSILIGHVVGAGARPGSPLGYFNGGFHDFGIYVD
ncbi:MAG: flavin reductase family protein [Candidatus Eremiobacteraeota bacterium]|nr:flavin reductase family protein [Candidatus Eremiobacteraeota bacterium]MBV9057131.1 flavin reductase family protein [Candidatus Eremiobacteraeota bacterium]MBV9700554.1 flavin reductase family protein [Candidatus Eremiobacteraeota bacterium]